MIKTTQKDNTKRLIIVIIILVAAAIVASGLYVAYGTNLFNHSKDTDSTINERAPTNEEVDAGAEIKDESVNGSKDGSSDTPAAPIPQENGKSKVIVSITSSNVNSGTLQVRALIEAVVSNGTCTLTLTKDDNTITKTSNTQALPSTSTCQGFDIPTSELSSGQWTLNLTFNTETYEGNVTTTVSI